MTKRGFTNLLRLTSEDGVDVLWIGSYADPETGQRVPLAEVTYNSLDMWLALSDGVAHVVEGEPGVPLVMVPLDWIEKTFEADATSGLPRIREILRENGLLEAKRDA